MRSYGPVRCLDYNDTHAIVCARYYTSCCIQQNCQMHFIARSQALKTLSNTLPSTFSSTLPIALDDTLPACLTIRSQVSSQDTLNCTQWHTLSLLDYTLPSKLSRRSQLHSMAHSQPAWLYVSKKALKTLPIALKGTLPAFLTVRSQVSSQDALNHTPEHALKYTTNCTRWHTPSLLDYTLLSKLSRRSQLHSMAHSRPAWLYAPK